MELADKKAHTMNGEASLRCFLTLVPRRTAGVPFRGITDLRFDETVRFLDAAIAAHTSARHSALEVCQDLEKAIDSVHDRSIRLALIQLKRNVYNGRYFKLEHSYESLSAITGLEAGSLAAWVDSMQAYDRHLRDAAAAFEREFVLARRSLMRLFCNRQFRRGLTLASSDLSYELNRYVAASSSSRRHRTERALLRYYTRAAFKLSPFSSFTHTQLGYVSPRPSSAALSCSPMTRFINRVSLNCSLLAELGSQITNYRDFRDYTTLLLNGTLLIQGTSILYIQRRANQTWPTRLRVPSELFVRTRNTNVLRWLVEHFHLHGGSATRGHLALALGQALGDIPAAAAYLERLEENGILVPAPWATDDAFVWIEHLTVFLSRFETPAASILIHYLEELACLLTALNRDTVASRTHSLSRIKEIFTGCFSVLGTIPSRDLEGFVAFEDCVLPRVTDLPSSFHVQDTFGDLTAIVENFGLLLDRNVSLRVTIRHILGTHFADAPVPFLHFVALWGHVFADTSACDNVDCGYTPNPLGLANLAVLADIRKAFGAVFAGNPGHEIDLAFLPDAKKWKDILRELGLTVHNEVLDFSFHLQPLDTAQHGLLVVCNKLVNGAGRLALRYCSALPESLFRTSLIDTLQKNLTALWPHGDPCEISGTFDYNVNQHPPVTDQVIAYIDGHSKCTHIPLTDLMLNLNADGRAYLSSLSTQREIIPLHLGAMGSSFLPLTYRLLACFGSGEPLLLRPFDPFFWRPVFDNTDEIYSIPRVRFGKVLLRRKGWLIPRSRLPLRQANQTDFSYFSSVREWQTSLNLPDEIFVYERTALEWITEANDSTDRRTWNRRKPQYIDLTIFPLVDLFGRQVSDCRSALYIEEMLPHTKTWRHLGQRRASEIILDGSIVYP